MCSILECTFSSRRTPASFRCLRPLISFWDYAVDVYVLCAGSEHSVELEEQR